MDNFKQFVNQKKIQTENYISNLINKKDDEEELEELINYEKHYQLFSQELNRINNLFNNDSENTFKYITYLQHIEEIKFHLKKVLELQVDKNKDYTQKEESLKETKQRLRQNMLTI